MRDYKSFINAYHRIKRSFLSKEKAGKLPELSEIVWSIIVGIPPVPADEYSLPEAQDIAIDQRIAIYKAIFVELNKDQPEEFIDQGLSIYDAAAKLARQLYRTVIL